MSERATATLKAPEAKATKAAPQKRRPEISASTTSIPGQIVALQRSIGNRGAAQLYRLGLLQAKLKIGSPHDIYEQEADRVAEQVMRMPGPTLQMKPG